MPRLPPGWGGPREGYVTRSTPSLQLQENSRLPRASTAPRVPPLRQSPFHPSTNPASNGTRALAAQQDDSNPRAAQSAINAGRGAATPVPPLDLGRLKWRTRPTRPFRTLAEKWHDQSAGLPSGIVAQPQAFPFEPHDVAYSRLMGLAQSLVQVEGENTRSAGRHAGRARVNQNQPDQPGNKQPGNKHAPRLHPMQA